MRSTTFARQAFSADERRLVTLGAVMKVGACALVCAVLTLIAFAAIEPPAVDSVAHPQMHHPAATFAPPQRIAASTRRELYEERRARFNAARGDAPAARTAGPNNSER
jgi:hypothetical protein